MNIVVYIFNSLYKEDVLYQGDTTQLPEFQAQPNIASYVQETTKVPEEDITTTKNNKMKAFWDIFRSMTNFHLLRNKSLLLICVVKYRSIMLHFQFDIYDMFCLLLNFSRLIFSLCLVIIHLIYLSPNLLNSKEVFLIKALFFYYQ